MRSEISRRNGRLGLAQAFRDLALVTPLAAAATGGGETGPASLSFRLAQVYAGGRPREEWAGIADGSPRRN